MDDNSSRDEQEKVDAEKAAMERFRRQSDEALSQQPRRRVPDTIALLQDQWHRFSNTSRLEKAIMFAGIAIAVIGITIVAGALLAGGNGRPDDPIQVVAPTRDSGRSPTAEPTVAEPTAEQLPTNTPASVRLPVNREDCDTILGTAYRSNVERAWFLANCQVTPSSVSSDPAGNDDSVSNGANETATPVAAPTIASPYNVSRIDAIALGVEWLNASSIDQSSLRSNECAASHVYDLWLVTCAVSLGGCQDAVCSSWRSVCVSDADGVILPNDAC